jgi:N-acetylmuramoyl-L-alanine amidase
MLHGMREVLSGVVGDNRAKGDTATKIGGQQGALTGSIYSQAPTVTVEMVFLSNQSDAHFIGTEQGRTKMVEALAAGVDCYADMVAGRDAHR